MHNALLVLAAVVVLAALPCLVFAIIFIDDACVALARTIRRVRKRHDSQIGPPIEQIVEDLQRLGTARITGTYNRQVRRALTASYDRRLILACAALDIGQHLDMLDGLDRAIERVRIEGALLEAGLSLRHVAIELGVDGKTDHK